MPERIVKNLRNYKQKRPRRLHEHTRSIQKHKQKLFALVSVFSEHLFPLMCRHLLTLSFFSAGHNILLTSNSVFQYRKIRAERQEHGENLSSIPKPLSNPRRTASAHYTPLKQFRSAAAQ